MDYNYENIRDFYNEVIKRSVIETHLTDLETKMLEGLLQAKSSSELKKWVDTYPKSDNTKPSGVEILHDKLQSLTPSDFENFSSRLITELTALDMQQWDNEMGIDRLAESAYGELYNTIISNSISNNANLHSSERAIYRQLENADSVADIQKWASEVRYGGNLYYSDETPNSVQENVRQLAQLIYDADDDTLQFILNDIQEERYSDKLNHIRMDSLRERYDNLKMLHPSEVILFKNREGFTIIGDDALKVMNITGWPAGMVRDSVNGEIMWMLNINNDGYETLVGKDVNLRTTLPLGYLNPLTNQWFNKTNYALQSIDYNLSIAERANVKIPIENLSIGDFKANQLNITETRMDAVSENGESMVIRDIPDNFYHLEGTLVVADYINGNRKTIESIISNAQKAPVQQEETFLDQRARQNEEAYKKTKSANPDTIVAVEDNNIFFSYGSDGETIARSSAAILHKTPSGISYVSATRSDIETFLDNAENKSLRLVQPLQETEGAGISVTRESIKIDESKPGAWAMVHKNDEGGYSVTEMFSDGQTNGPLPLTEEDAKEYERLRREGSIKDRSDFVVAVADKYFHQEIKQGNNIEPDMKGKSPAQNENTAVQEKTYYTSVAYLQSSDDTREFDELKDADKYDEILNRASDYDNGDAFEQSSVTDRAEQNAGDDLLDENAQYAVVYNASVGGTYEILRKITEQDIRDNIIRYGVESDASEAVKKIANAIVKKEFENIRNMPAFTMDNGSVLYFQYNEETNKVEVGTVTNAGLAPRHEFDYDHGYSLDQNLDSVYEQLSEMPEYQQEEESEEQDLDNDYKPERVSFESKEDLKAYITDYCEKHGWDSDLNHIDVSRITDMSHLFTDSKFTGDISKWDTGNVITMREMFSFSSFNGDISNWNTEKVENMSFMFWKSQFNQPLDKWNTSNVKDMSCMFYESPFNQPLNNWDVSKVRNMSGMFKNTPFNQPLDKWVVSEVQDTCNMFENSPFSQDISSWDIEYLRDASYMFKNSGIKKIPDGWDLSEAEDTKDILGTNDTVETSVEQSPENKYTLPEQDADMVNEPTPLEGYGKYWNFVSAKVLSLDLAGYSVAPEVTDLAVKHLKGETLTDEEREKIEKANESHAEAIEKDGRRNYIDFTARNIAKEAGATFQKPTAKEVIGAELPQKDVEKPTEKKVNPAELKGTAYHAYLLGKTLSEASENDGQWLNKFLMSAPSYMTKSTPVPAYNQIVMALNAQERNYATNVYLSFDDAKGQNVFVHKGEKAIGLVNYDSRQFVNSFRAAEVISQEEYDKLPKEERSLFRPAERRGMKELVSMFNIAQTTMEKDSPEKYKELLASAHRDEKPELKDPIKIYEAFKKQIEENPDTCIFMNTGGFYETYDETAEKVAPILDIPVTTDEERGCKVASFPVSKSYEMVALLNETRQKVSLCNTSFVNNRNLTDYCKEAYDFVKQTADNMGVSVDKITYMSTVYNKKDDAIHIKTDNISTSKEKISSIKDINAMYRALVDATDKSERLDRSARLNFKPEDAKKYNALITELTAGVLMMKQGLPARISEENMPLIPYWQRELRENPTIMDTIERNVDSAYKAIMRHHDGIDVNYSDIRDTKQTEFMQPKFYSIINELAKHPNAETRQAVIVRDPKTSTATVILPAGASVDPGNEIPGMNKNRFRVALGKEKFENINFYNADGYLSLNQPNNFFIGKEISVEKLRQYNLEKIMDINIKNEIIRTEKPEMLLVTPIRNDEGKYEIYVKPAEGKPFTVTPMPEDLTDLFNALKMENKEAASEQRKAIGQKYCEIIQKYPEALTNTLYPNTDGVDLSRIQKVSITKDKQSGENLMFIMMNDKWLQPKKLTNDQFGRLRFVPDATQYKIALASNVFAKELGREMSESQTVDNGEKKETVTQESKDDTEDINKGNSKNVNRADTDSKAEAVNTPVETEETQSDEESNEQDDKKEIRHGGRRR